MELSTLNPTFALDVSLIETKKSSELSILMPNDIVKTNTIKWYDTPSEISANLLKAPPNLSFKEVALNKIPSKPSYLNLANTKKLNKIEVLNKFIIDSDLHFKRPDQTTNVFYEIVFDSNQEIETIYYVIIRTPQNEGDGAEINDKGNLPPRNFLEMVEVLNNNSQVVFLLGFGMSFGCNIENNIQKSLPLIPIWNLLNTALDYFQPIVKPAVESFQTNDGLLIESVYTTDLNLSRVYFIDSRHIMFQQLTKIQKTQILDHSFLEYYASFSKENYEQTLSTYKQQKEKENAIGVRNNLSDLMEFAKYFVLRNQLEQRLQLITILNVPLSFALYQTTVTCLSQYLFRQFKKEQWMFMYKRIGDYNYQLENVSGLNGGIFELINQENKYLPLMYVLEGDYTSEYPSLIMSFNISPETLVPADQADSTCNKLIINYQTGQDIESQKYVYFRAAEQQLGIFPQLCTYLLTMRKNYRSNDPTNKTLKTTLASIYGLLGMTASPLFERICQQVVCSLGRKACDVAKQAIESSALLGNNAVVARFTDSCQFLLPHQGKQISSQFKKILTEWPIIQKKIKEQMNAPLLDFKLEERFALLKIYLKQTNSSIAITAKIPDPNDKSTKVPSLNKIDVEQLIKSTENDRDEAVQMIIKGQLSLKKYNSEMIRDIKKIIATICVKAIQSPETEMVEIATQVIDEAIYNPNKKDISIFNDVKSLQDFSADAMKHKNGISPLDTKYNLILKYSRLHRFSNQDRISLHLAAIYGIQSECRIIPFIPSTKETLKEKSKCWIPVSELDKIMKLQGDSKIQKMKEFIERLDTSCFKLILDPIKQLFGINTQLNSYDQESSTSLLKDVVLNPGQCQIRIEESRGTYKKMTFHIVSITDLHSIIQKNQHLSIHEITSNSLNKIYFDIESKDHCIEESEVRLQVTRFMQILIPYVYSIPIHIATAHGPVIDENGNPVLDESGNPKQKYSFHCIVDVACHKAVNEFIANQMKPFLHNAVDVGVYRSNSSIRLPGTVKIDKYGQIEDRKFTYSSNECFANFIIQDISNCTITLDENILFDTVDPLTITKLIGKMTPQLIEEALQEIKTKTNNPNWYIYESPHKTTKNQNTITFNCRTPYRCFICNTIHSSDGLYGIGSNSQILINCYSNKMRQNNVHPPVLICKPIVEIDDPEDLSLKTIRFERFKHRIESIQKDDYKDSMLSTQCKKDVEFALNLPTTYVISGMGSGKSQQLKKILQSPEYHWDKNDKNAKPLRIVCLSFRKTFTTEFAQKYGLKSYKEIPGTIKLSDEPRVIIQVDSLFRLDTSIIPDLLIIDEVESILEKLESSGNKWQNIAVFIDLLKNSIKVILMDGLMERISIKYLNLIRKTDNFEIIYNTYLSRATRPPNEHDDGKGYTLKLYQYHSSQFQWVLDLFMTNLKNNKKIYGMITQKTLGQFTADFLRSQGYKTIFYDGDNLKIEESEGYKNHQDIKDEHFKNVNHYWQQYDVVLHNSTVTAGISFTEKHFDIQINVLSTNTCSAVSFIQGCHRVRNLTDKTVYTFIEPHNKLGHHKPIDFTNNMYQFHNENNNPNIKIGLHEQVQCWLLLRKCMSLNCIVDLVIKYSKSMGYTIEPQMIPGDFKGSKFNLNTELAKQISFVPLPETFEEICKLDAEHQQSACRKFELARIFDLFTPVTTPDGAQTLQINVLGDAEIKFLLKHQYTQIYRRNLTFTSALIKYDNEDHTEKYWNFQYDWLLHIQYEPHQMQFSIEMLWSQSIMKLKDILIKTRQQALDIDAFDLICQQAKFDLNVLNEIQDLHISVKSTKTVKIPPLSKIIIAFMHVLCYDVKLSQNRIQFFNVSVRSKIGLPLPTLKSERTAALTQLCAQLDTTVLNPPSQNLSEPHSSGLMI